MCEQNIQKPEIMCFVEELFESSRIRNVSGIIIELNRGRHIMISLAEVDDSVIIFADNKNMGTLQPSGSKGYKCNFHQQYRKGMKTHGLTENEQFIKGVFESEDSVRVFEA